MAELTEADLVDLAHSRLRYNAPLAPARADDLLRRLGEAPGPEAGARRSVVDLGCGDARFLLELVASAGDIEGVGVDRNARAIARAAALARERGLAGRVRLVEADVVTVDLPPADVVVCVGVRHAWPDGPAAFADLLRRTRPGGRLLFGDGFWAAPPPEATRDIFGELPTLAGLVEQAVSAGWRPLHVAEATLDEHDTWESDWRAGLELSGHLQARALADERRAEYLGAAPGYRGVLGFAWLVLTPG